MRRGVMKKRDGEKRMDREKERFVSRFELVLGRHAVLVVLR